MSPNTHGAPQDAEARRAIKPVICYPNETLPAPDLALYRKARETARKVDEVLVPARDARCFEVPAGGFFRISSVEGPQVGDLNLWNRDDLSERFYSGKTRALHGTHITTGERMWSSFPQLRPMATIIEDTLGWYGMDEFGGSVHDVIGTRCDPYTGNPVGRQPVPPLLPLQPYPRARRSHRPVAGGGRTPCARRAERVHVHRVYPGYRAVLYESLAGASWRLSGILCRD